MDPVQPASITERIDTALTGYYETVLARVSGAVRPHGGLVVPDGEATDVWRELPSGKLPFSD